jgi:hypothetical protein
MEKSLKDALAKSKKEIQLLRSALKASEAMVDKLMKLNKQLSAQIYDLMSSSSSDSSSSSSSSSSESD